MPPKTKNISCLETHKSSLYPPIPPSPNSLQLINDSFMGVALCWSGKKVIGRALPHSATLSTRSVLMVGAPQCFVPLDAQVEYTTFQLPVKVQQTFTDTGSHPQIIKMVMKHVVRFW